MSRPIVHGADYSVYVRIVRLALEEKGVSYELQPVDVFAEGGPPADYLALHPFGRIPTLWHDHFVLYETSAIVHYINDAFEGPPLAPEAARPLARMNQIIALLDHYAYRAMVWDVYVESRHGRSADGAPEPQGISQGLATSARCLGAINRIRDVDDWLVGDALSLADLYALPMIDLFCRTPQGRTMIDNDHRWRDWYQAMTDRPSYAATAPTIRDD